MNKNKDKSKFDIIHKFMLENVLNEGQNNDPSYLIDDFESKENTLLNSSQSKIYDTLNSHIF